MYSTVPKYLNISRYLLFAMYLQKQLSKKIGDKEYAKYVIVVPPKLIDKLKWKGGEELEAEVKGDKLVIERD